MVECLPSIYEALGSISRSLEWGGVTPCRDGQPYSCVSLRPRKAQTPELPPTPLEPREATVSAAPNMWDDAWTVLLPNAPLRGRRQLWPDLRRPNAQLEGVGCVSVRTLDLYLQKFQPTPSQVSFPDTLLTHARVDKGQALVLLLLQSVCALSISGCCSLS